MNNATRKYFSAVAVAVFALGMATAIRPASAVTMYPDGAEGTRPCDARNGRPRRGQPVARRLEWGRPLWRLRRQCAGRDLHSPKRGARNS